MYLTFVYGFIVVADVEALNQFLYGGSAQM